MDQQTDPRILLQTNAKTFAATIYLVAFITGAIVMSFEMLGSRYLNPYFGSGIYTWASLISTVLAALCVGSGTVYGISTLGSIVGTLGTTFILIPSIGTRAITFTLGIAGVLSGLLLIAAPKFRRAALALAIVALAAPSVRAEDLIDLQIRAEMLKHKD